MSHTYDFDLDDETTLELELAFEPVSSYNREDVHAELLANGQVMVGYLCYDEDCEAPDSTSCDGAGFIYNYKHHENEWKRATGRHYDEDERDTDALRDLAYQVWPNRGDRDWTDLLRDPQGEITRDNIKRPYRGKWDTIRRQQEAAGDFGDPDRVMLDMYEHGGIAYHVGYNPGFPDRQWDCSWGGAVWVPDKYLRNEEAKGLKGEARRQKMVEWAEQLVETMNEWMGGSCYTTEVELFDQEGNQLEHDSCGGHIGRKWAEEALETEMKWRRENAQKETA